MACSWGIGCLLSLSTHVCSASLSEFYCHCHCCHVVSLPLLDTRALSVPVVEFFLLLLFYRQLFFLLFLTMVFEGHTPYCLCSFFRGFSGRVLPERTLASPRLRRLLPALFQMLKLYHECLWCMLLSVFGKLRLWPCWLRDSSSLHGSLSSFVFLSWGGRLSE